MNDIIKEISSNAARPLLNISQTGAKHIQLFEIDCALLEDYNNINILHSERYKSLFDDLQKMTGPCLYYFEITSNHIPNEIINSIKTYSLSEYPKATPAIKKQPPIDSKILYVGEVKRHMYGRLIQHLGFFKTSATQGLQLFYWARTIPLSLKLTVMEFEPEMENLMEVLENELARKLKPILGKHK